MRTLDFKLLQISENDLYGNTHQYARRFKEKSSGKTAIMSIRSYDTQIRFLSYAIETWFRKLLSDGRKKFVAWIVTIICLTCPTVTLNDNASISVSNNMAYAQSLGSIRQAALFLERLGGSTPAKVLDKVVTVISGQAVVTPETVEQLKSILEEKDPEDWKRDITNGVETLWSTAVDVISHFDPISLLETTGNSIQGLVEAGAERFAAFELSALVSLGERWILWTPFVILPMYWQMTKNKNDELASGSSSKSQVEITELSEEAIAKAARVKNELERIELKASLLDLVYSLGKLTWQSNRTDENPKRKQIDEILARLQVLNPTSAIALEIVPLAPDGTAESPYVQPLIDVDGDWNLIYVSQAPSQPEQTQFPQLLNLNIPGIELSNMQQKLWRKSLKTSIPTNDSEAQLLLAKNTAQIRLGPLGVMEISVQGSWENQNNGESALVTFHTFSAKPVEVLGSHIRGDLPPLDLAIPSTFRTSGEWKTVYLDNSLRINRGRTGQLFLFRKSQ
ncbi:hypothetical protein KP509_10G019900 [Ceratopteris richardii]|nr:hypothetical protein KP509_10G019900 [Ceratopteris richardii]